MQRKSNAWHCLVQRRRHDAFIERVRGRGNTEQKQQPGEQLIADGDAREEKSGEANAELVVQLSSNFIQFPFVVFERLTPIYSMCQEPLCHMANSNGARRQA